MGKVKRLELWWQLYRMSLPVRDLENFRPMGFCWTEGICRKADKGLLMYLLVYLFFSLVFSSFSLHPFIFKMLHLRSCQLLRYIWCGCRWKNDRWILVQWYWQRKTEELEPKTIPVPLCPLEIPRSDRFCVVRWRENSLTNQPNNQPTKQPTKQPTNKPANQPTKDLRSQNWAKRQVDFVLLFSHFCVYRIALLVTRTLNSNWIALTLTSSRRVWRPRHVGKMRTYAQEATGVYQGQTA